MLRKNLLLTTAFVVATASLFLAAPAALAQPATVGVGRDSNKEFLRTYGGDAGCAGQYFTISSYSANYGSSSFVSDWTNVAVPITGYGKTVQEIVVKEEYSSGHTSSFSAGIYSNTSSGFPGRLIAGGTGIAVAGCGKVTISIRPTRLSRGTIYWVEETAPRNPSSVHMYWKAALHPRHTAYSQSHWARDKHSNFSSYTSPWTLLQGAPYLRLR